MIRLQQKKLLQERRNTRQPQQSEQQLMKMQMRRLQSLFSSKNNVMFKLSKSYTEVACSRKTVCENEEIGINVGLNCHKDETWKH